MAALGVIDKKYVSAVDSMFDTRAIDPGLVDVNNDNQLTDILYIGQRTKPVEQPVYYDFYGENLFKQIDTTASTVTNSGTKTVTVTGITAATSGYNRVGDELILQGTTGKVLLISSVTSSGGQDTLILQSVDETNVTITAGMILNSFSRAVGERSDSPLNLKFGATKDFNKLQAFREVSQITDIQSMSTITVTINGQQKFAVLDHINKTIRLKGQINAAMIGGQVSTTSYSDVTPFLVDTNAPTNGGGGGAVQTTRGLDHYITDRGGVVTAAASLGTLTGADFATTYAALTAKRAGTDYMVLGGRAAFGINDAYWKNLGSGGLTSARLMVNGNDVNTTVQTVTNNGYNLEFVNLPILDQPDLFGGTMISKSIYFVPKNAQVKTTGNSSEPSLQIRYFPRMSNTPGMDNGGLISEINSGAFNVVNPNGTIAEMRTEWYTVQGLQALGVAHMARMRVIT